MRRFMMRGRLYMSREDDWTWLSSWIGGMIEKWKSEGLSEEQIIEELKKYGDIKEIKKG